ncbi:hypothetical protein BH23CHL5_BH23CHL5_25870 [soil metagenome]
MVLTITVRIDSDIHVTGVKVKVVTFMTRIKYLEIVGTQDYIYLV